MGAEFNLDKEIAPVAKHLVAGNTQKAVPAIAAVLVKAVTGSSTIKDIAEETPAGAIVEALREQRRRVKAEIK